METKAYHTQYLTQIVTLWNQTLTADPITEERFLKKVIFDENFSEELCRVYLEADQVIGFIWGVKRKYPYGERGLESARGWIITFFVAESHRRTGIGRKLIEEVEHILTESDAERITIAAYSPNYLFPGVDINHYSDALPFLEALGYVKGGSAVSMSQDLTKFKFSEFYLQHRNFLKEQGYRLEAFTLAESEKLVAFLQENFPGGWGKNVKEAIFADRAEKTIFILKKQEEIVGYCQRAIDGNPGRFGPFGVKEELRGLKLGMYLFNEMMFDMFKNQIYFTYFLWTSGSAQTFYEKNGMSVYREYQLMEKII